jgi:hypothetical protein
VALILAACGAGGDAGSVTSSTVSSSTAPTTTAAPTTAVSTTLGSSATSTTVAPGPVTLDVFDPPCIDRGPSRPARALDPTGLDRLEPLGAEPVVQVLLPRATGVEAGSDVTTEAHVVPGGVLLVVRSLFDEGAGAMVALVDDDGPVRWVRCLVDSPSVVVVPSAGTPSEVFVATVTSRDGIGSSNLEAWSLADGAVSRTWDELLAEASGTPGTPVDDADLELLVVWSEGPQLGGSRGWARALVLGTARGRAIASDDRLYVVGPTGGVEVLAVPASTVGMMSFEPRYSLLDGNRRLALLAVDDELVAVQDGAAWTSDPSVLDAARPLRAVFGPIVGQEGEYGLAGVDATGDVRWNRDDLLMVGVEGLNAATSDGVSLVRACPAPRVNGPDGQCSAPLLVAIDPTSGRTLWERPGWWGVSVVADGRALVNGPFPDGPRPVPLPWELIDLRSGGRVGDRTWDEPWRFDIGCCASPEGAVVSGGAVVTVDGDTVELWYPEARTTPIVVVDLAEG